LEAVVTALMGAIADRDGGGSYRCSDKCRADGLIKVC
jgi:hypothetical protein